MNSVLPTHSLFPPNIFEGRLSPNHRSYSSPASTLMPSSSSRKRQRDDADDPDRMSQSPSASPSIPNSALPASTSAPGANRRLKRARTNMNGRPLALPRLLETLNADEMRGLLKQICDRRPDVAAEVVNSAPRPSVPSVLEILQRYEANLRQAFPVGSQTSEYAYNRVRQPLAEMYDALRDYTPHFLPPHETQPAISLSFLDEVTGLLHRLPNWESFQHNRHKAEAYEEMAKAWALVVREAAKKGAGIQLQYQGWDQKLAKHNEISGGKMEEAMQELRASLGWMGSSTMTTGQEHQQQLQQDDASSIRQQLLSGTYGLGQTVRYDDENNVNDGKPAPETPAIISTPQPTLPTPQTPNVESRTLKSPSTPPSLSAPHPLDLVSPTQGTKTRMQPLSLNDFGKRKREPSTSPEVGSESGKVKQLQRAQDQDDLPSS